MSFPFPTGPDPGKCFTIEITEFLFIESPCSPLTYAAVSFALIIEFSPKVPSILVHLGSVAISAIGPNATFIPIALYSSLTIRACS